MAMRGRREAAVPSAMNLFGGIGGTMKREPRYTVLKNTDAEKHLDGDDISLLVALCDKVTLGRYRTAKPAFAANAW